ncbi:hypothetical protein MAR_002942 [Mya arenaria]|uniref:Uncharacterized protein n=1 Tax=Mya arenaria TaxID=6604 RepID=A0ABY7G7K1_MYAAR|nr:hypothetical protein MAR_002942 [Mya arenaria]
MDERRDEKELDDEGRGRKRSVMMMMDERRDEKEIKSTYLSLALFACLRNLSRSAFVSGLSSSSPELKNKSLTLNNLYCLEL